jgi:hypothetical protein
MLPFLKESDSGELPAESPQGQSGDLTNLTGAQDFLTVAERGKHVRHSTMFVVVLFGLGLLGVWFMVQKTKPNAASAAEMSLQEAEIEGAISRLTGGSSEMMTRMDEIVNKFYEFSEVYQVQVDELSKNPFALETSTQSGLLKEEEESSNEEDETHKDLMKRLTVQTKALSLLGIMQGENGNRCMIGEDVLQQGERTGEFKVLDISATAVELEWIPAGVDLSKIEATDTHVILKLSE